MKKKYQKILGFLFFFSIFFSFVSPATANTVSCNKDEDCNSPLLYCKPSPPLVTGVCAVKSSGEVVSSIPTNQTPTTNNGDCSWEFIYNTECPSGTYYAWGKCPTETRPATYSHMYETRTYGCCCKGATGKTIVKPVDINPLGKLNIKIPGIDKLAEKHPATCSTDSDGKTSCSIPWIAIYIKAIYNYFLYIGGIVAVIALMIGGIIWLVSAGNASRISEAKSWIIGSITGIVILLSSYVLLYQINPKLTEFKSMELKTIDPIIAEAEETAPVDYSGANITPSNQWVSLSVHSNIINNAVGKTNPKLANAIIKAADCMKAYNYKIEVTSLSRTIDSQIKIYGENYTHEPNKCGTLKKDKNIACCPYPTGTKLCPHTSGNAADLWGINEKGLRSHTAQAQLQSCMFENGACLLNTECWHFELPALSGICTQNKNTNGNSCQKLAK